MTRSSSRHRSGARRRGSRSPIAQPFPVWGRPETRRSRGRSARRAPRRPPRPRWRCGGLSADGCGSRPKQLDQVGHPARVPLGSRRARGSRRRPPSPRLGEASRQRSAGSSEGRDDRRVEDLAGGGCPEVSLHGSDPVDEIEMVALDPAVRRPGTVARMDLRAAVSTTRSIGWAGGRVCLRSVRRTAPTRPSPRRGHSSSRLPAPARDLRDRFGHEGLHLAPARDRRRARRDETRRSALGSPASREPRAASRRRRDHAPAPRHAHLWTSSAAARFQLGGASPPLVSLLPGYSPLSRRPAYALA